jgi:putative hydrolase of the HAD superfamily
MPIQGVIFDLGHTLMDLQSTWAEVFEQGVTDLAPYLGAQAPELDGRAFARSLLDRRAEMFARAKETLREVTAEDSMRWTFARYGVLHPSPALVDGAIDAFFAYEDSRWSASGGALDVLAELFGQGLRLGMFSNATHDPFIQRLVDRFGFRPWLDPALTSAQTGVRKPDPSAFAPILAAWNLPPQVVAMVGDTLAADVLGAKQAGMRGVWLRARDDARQEGNAGPAPPDMPILPDVTISQLAELPACLRHL